MNEFIDIYCERLGPGLWAEPLNAVSNAAFFIAAFFAYRLARRENALTWRSLALITLIFAMGVGSTLFHTFATHWAMLADVLPILIFQIVFIAVYAQRVMNVHCGKSAALLGLFFVAMYVSMQAPREWLNGSLEYAPALVFVMGLGLLHMFYATREKFGLLAAGGVFIVSLGFRSVDMAVCEALPIGTHYAWHCLNAIVLYLSTRAYILNAEKI